MAINVVSNAIVLEVLRQDNYANWSVCVKNYLLTQDLWDIIEDNTASPEPHEPGYRKWRKTNAMALHAIQISCGPEILCQIRDKSLAKEAWNTLATMFGGIITADLLVEQFTHNGKYHVQLFFQYVESGEWVKANNVRNEYPAVISSFSDSGRTALHIAVIAGHVKIVEDLVWLMPPNRLELQDHDKCTALAFAANLNRKTSMAECMVRKNKNLLRMRDDKDLIPVVQASARGHKDMTRYLYRETCIDILKQKNGLDGALLLTHSITSEIFDVALNLLKDYDDLPIAFDFNAPRPCQALARIPWKQTRVNDTNDQKCLNDEKYSYDRQELTHPQAVELILDQICVKIKTLDESKLKEAKVYEAMLEAVQHGNTKFVKKMTEARSDLFWVVDEHSRGIYFYAILYRREQIFSLIYGLQGKKEKIASQRDVFYNNMLHLVGILPPSSELDCRSGAALQMQRELQWYKAVEGIVHPRCKEELNIDNKKPCELFAKNHEDLLKEGEKWAKDTATSFTVVGTLIITIMFAAAFTVPGGSHQETGIPFLLQDWKFTVFIISDALSLCTSSTSVLIFLGILISRYAAEDFLEILPRNLFYGLLSLFVSVASMMIAFVAALSIMLHNDLPIVIVAIIFASAPIFIFVLKQYHLVSNIYNATYSSKILADRKMKMWC